MKKLTALIFILTLVSCGKKKNNDDKDVEISQAIQAQNYCNEMSYNYMCTAYRVYNRQLFNYELYNQSCLYDYNDCIDKETRPRYNRRTTN